MSHFQRLITLKQSWKQPLKVTCFSIVSKISRLIYNIYVVLPSEDGAGIPFTVLLIASPLLFRLFALPVDGETAVSSLDIL